MNWLTNVVRPKIRNMLRRETPENLWIKCPDSGQLVFYKDVEANQMVIPGSNYHMRMGAVARIKRHTKLPVCVGFGIRTPDTARAIAARADGAVVGTALVDALRGSLDADGKATARTVTAVADLAAALAAGVRGAKQAAE